MTAYKVTICKTPGWREFKACTLGVSVTSANWEGERFASILDFASDHFETIRLDVTDLPYRHGFEAQGLTPHQAEARACALGASWLERHETIIATCPVKPEVVRWGKWYEQPDYAGVLEQFEHAETTSTVLYHAIENDLGAFFRRQGYEPNGNEREHAKRFLLEELAVITLQSRAAPSLRIYPGEQLACMRVVAQGLVPEAPRGLEREQFAQVNMRSRIAFNAAINIAATPAPNHPDLAAARRTPWPARLWPSSVDAALK